MKNEKSKGLQVKGSGVELTAPHLDSERTFIYPPVRGSYAKCAKQINNAKLIQPTFSEIISLVYGAWQNPKERYSDEIIELMNAHWIRGFTGILYDNYKGAYIQDKPKIKNGRVLMDKDSLVKKLEANDSSVRFVPFGYKTGGQSSKSLAENPFVIALSNGEEQAEKLAKVADNYRIDPYLFSCEPTYEPSIRVSALYSFSSNDRLGVRGDDGDDGGSYAFGMKR